MTPWARNCFHTTFWRSFEINVRGTLNVALSYLASISPRNKQGVFVALDSAGVFMPPFPGVGAYLSSKLASVKMLNGLAAESRGKAEGHACPPRRDQDGYGRAV